MAGSCCSAWTTTRTPRCIWPNFWPAFPIGYQENDHCCQLFRSADDWLKQSGVQSEGMVGHARSRLMRSRDLIDTVVPRIERDPLVFLHPRDSGCEECTLAWASIPD